MLSDKLINLHPYVPGEQPKDRVYIKLNANESPYAPHKSVVKAVKKYVTKNPQKLALYPDPDSNELRSEIAAMLNRTGGVLCNSFDDLPDEKDKIPFEVTPDMIFTGNGSDEVLSFVFYTFFNPGQPVVTANFTYSFYPVYAGFYGLTLEQVPLKDDWTLDTQKMISFACSNNSPTIFANPNAPTGLALTRNQIRELLLKAPKDRVFVVDEAYCDFGGESSIPLLQEFKNLVIVRTFSKSFSFAGMRLGYVVSNPEVVKHLFTVKNSFNHFPCDVLSQQAGIASCKASNYYARCARLVCQERSSIIDFLKSRGWFVLDSTTNFVFAKKDGVQGHAVYEEVKKCEILIRHFATPGIDNFVRISIGTKKQMALLKKALEKF